MKRFIVTLAMAVSLVFAACAKKTTVDDVVNKMVQAVGGAEKLAAIQDQVSTWDIKMVVPAPQGDSMMTVSGEMIITYKRPDKIKFAINGPDGATMWATGFDGANGWIMMMGQRRDMSSAEIQENTTTAETWIDQFHGYSQKGIKLALLADTTMDGKAYHVIQATDRVNNTFKNYCNSQTGLIERAEGEATDAMSGQKQAYTMAFADFAAYDGFMMAKAVTNYGADGNVLFEATLKDMKNNTGVADDVFAKPATPTTTENPAEPTAEKK
jgi:outer membrane lipoprotein-sorting protein